MKAYKIFSNFTIKELAIVSIIRPAAWLIVFKGVEGACFNISAVNSNVLLDRVALFIIHLELFQFILFEFKNKTNS